MTINFRKKKNVKELIVCLGLDNHVLIIQFLKIDLTDLVRIAREVMETGSDKPAPLYVSQAIKPALPAIHTVMLAETGRRQLVVRRVEVRGFEPLTPALQRQCSPS